MLIVRGDRSDPAVGAEHSGDRRGVVCEEGETAQRVRAGYTVWIAPNERHWHGATAHTLMSHTTTTIGATEFHEAVTEADYTAANATPRS